MYGLDLKGAGAQVLLETIYEEQRDEGRICQYQILRA